MELKTKTSQWEHLSCPSPLARTYFSMAECGGSLWVFGGFGEGKNIFNDLQRFDIGLQQWEKVKAKNTPTPRYLHASTAHGNTLYVYGGSSSSGNSSKKLSLVESDELIAFDIGRGKWKRIHAKNMPVGRYGHAMATWEDRLVVCGGCRKSNEYLRDAYSMDIASKVWTKLPKLPECMAYHSLFSWGQYLYVFGGHNGHNSLGKLHRLSPGSTTWQEISVRGDVPRARCGCTIQVTAGGVAYAFGGYTEKGHDNDLYQLGLTTNVWKLVKVTSKRPLQRAYLQSGIYGGKIYVFGGYDGRSCISDFCRINVASALDISHILRVGPTKAAEVVLRHFESSVKCHSLSRGDLEVLLERIQKAFASVDDGRRSSRSSSSSCAKTESKKGAITSSRLVRAAAASVSTALDTAGFTVKVAV